MRVVSSGHTIATSAHSNNGKIILNPKGMGFGVSIALRVFENPVLRK